ERELDPDPEQQERDAELGELLDRLRVPDESEAARSREHARDEIRGHRRQAERAAGDQSGSGDGEEDDDVDGEHRNLSIHRRTVLTLGSSALRCAPTAVSTWRRARGG